MKILEIFLSNTIGSPSIPSILRLGTVIDTELELSVESRLFLNRVNDKCGQNKNDLL